MKNGFLLCLFLCVIILLPAQTAVQIEELLSIDALNYEQAAWLVLESADYWRQSGTTQTSSQSQAFQAARENNWLPDVEPGATARLDTVSLLLMKAFDLEGGLFYTLVGSPNYAYRELIYKDVIPGRTDPEMPVSGDILLYIVGRIYGILEDEAAAAAEREAAERIAAERSAASDRDAAERAAAEREAAERAAAERAVAEREAAERAAAEREAAERAAAEREAAEREAAERAAMTDAEREAADRAAAERAAAEREAAEREAAERAAAEREAAERAAAERAAAERAAAEREAAEREAAERAAAEREAAEREAAERAAAEREAAERAAAERAAMTDEEREAADRAAAERAAAEREAAEREAAERAAAEREAAERAAAEREAAERAAAEREAAERAAAERAAAPISFPVIYFAADSEVLRASEMEKLREIARTLETISQRTIYIHGFTALARTVQGQQLLSERRAQAVKDYLVSLGARTAEEIIIRGFGAGNPAGNNNTPSGMALNRRVEILLENF